MDHDAAKQFVEGVWDESILPALVEYVRIPNKSPHFDPRWADRGHMDRAVDLIGSWCRAREIDGLSVEVVRLEGRTPVIFMEIPGASDDTVLLYGHLDKQPEMTGWDEDLGPWKPVVRDDKLYGRGGADDGYAAFASLTAIETLQRQGIPHGRCIVLIEGCEESGSYDLPYYIDALRERIGSPRLVVCLDSGCGDYDRMWSTTSLRGIVTGLLSVETISEGVHSGDASGVVPDGFRVLRALLSRVEDQANGDVLLEEAQCGIPAQRREQATIAAEALGDAVWTKFPFHAGVQPVVEDPIELVLNRTWRPALAITGAGGLPAPEDAGNVLRPVTRAVLSLRVAPNADAEAAARRLKQVLEADPPYGARVSFELGQTGQGWNAPAVADWLGEAVDRASRDWFGAGAAAMGEGGSIPFMGMLGKEFPDAQFLITGVLGPKSNAHGPNEFLHLPTGRKLTGCVAQVLEQHFRHFGAQSTSRTSA